LEGLKDEGDNGRKREEMRRGKMIFAVAK